MEDQQTSWDSPGVPAISFFVSGKSATGCSNDGPGCRSVHELLTIHSPEAGKHPNIFQVYPHCNIYIYVYIYMYIYIYVWRIISPLPGRSCCGAHDSLSQLSVDPAKVTDLLTSAQRVQIGQQWTQQHPQTKEPQNSWEHHPFKEIQDGDFRIIIYILDIIYIL